MMLFYLSLVNIFMGLLIMGIAIPMVMEKIKPNMLYGFRTKKTLSDEKIWYASNKYAGKVMIWCGAVMVIISAVVMMLDRFTSAFVSVSEGAAVIIWSAVCMIPIVVMVILSMAYLKKL